MHPLLLRLSSGAAIHSYGALLGLAFVVAWRLVPWLCAREGMDLPLARRCLLFAAAGAFLGARALYVLTELPRFGGPWALLRVDQGGFMAYGGLLGGLAAAGLFCRRRGLSLLTFGDCAVPALCAGLLLARLGCFLAGCDFGLPSNAPWAVRFPAGSPAYLEQVASGLLDPASPRSLPVHPTQLYESAGSLFLLGVVSVVRQARRVRGSALATFAIGYALLRCALETLRGDGPRGQLGPFSTSQLIALVTLLAGAELLRRQWLGPPLAPEL